MKLMEGKRGLIMGVANDHSIAWGIASMLHQHGAELAFTYQTDAFQKARRAADAGDRLQNPAAAATSRRNPISTPFSTRWKKEWGKLDFLVHAVAYSNKEELKGKYVDTSLDNFLNTMHISCYSFTSLMRRAAPLMKNGGSAVTLTYYGADKVMPNYNVMGVAKAALEASVRYLAADLGPNNIRVNAISAGPMRTLAGAVIGSARTTFKYNVIASPLRRSVELEEVGGAALYLLSNLSSAVTGEVHFVDCGFNVVGMPQYDAFKEMGSNGSGS